MNPIIIGKSAVLSLAFLFVFGNGHAQKSAATIQKEQYYANTTFIPYPETSGGLSIKFSELSKDEQARLPQPVAVAKDKSEITASEKWNDHTEYRYTFDGKPIQLKAIEKLLPKVVHADRWDVPQDQRTQKQPQAKLLELYSEAGFNKQFPNQLWPAPKSISMADFPPPPVYPEFPGGLPAFKKYVSTHFRISDTMQDAELKVTVMVKFIVEPDGTIHEVTVLKDPGYGIGTEAIRVLQSAPKWEIPKNAGKIAPYSQMIPIFIHTKP